MTANIILIGADQVRRALGPCQAVEAIGAALRAGLDPAADPARMIVPTAHGQLLLMPAAGGDHAGVKVATVAPGNPTRGLPRIQGCYLLFDAATLSPVALLDGGALTTLRTSAVSIAAVLPFLRDGAHPRSVAVFGTGPQATAHVAALAAHCDLGEVTYLARRPQHVQPPHHGPVPVTVTATAGAEARRVLRRADVVVCATTAREPLFDSTLLGDRAVVLAIGSHEPDAREVDGPLLTRAHVIVEDVATATREAGDIILAVHEGHTGTTDLIPIRRIVTDPASVRFDRPVLFKSTGMAWEDLVIATAVHREIGWAGGRSGC
ncbi:MAG TPA: ornithine cyclodeaminase family protein [Actinophytocola sp.]|uniref:ornithine cyclodeaminase family protein n=1 Tax=Actinophytocola sp. TaxID=1872138 RepID=UPI002DBB5758|nr:ornithine cyclodeaminase family protein [Actinophytocola sp.]HEU5475089.1 ornithine cyclodeaminase family protein [Actinophytocola sp.]